MKKNLIFLILLCFTKVSFSQNVSHNQSVNSLIDSLTSVANTAKEDTVKINALNFLSKRLWLSGYYDRAMNNANKALELSTKIGFKKGVANAYNNIGVAYIKQTNYAEGLKYYSQAFNIRKEMGDKVAMGASYINIGNAYLELDNYPEALKNYFAALKIGEEVNDIGTMANSYTSIGNVYEQQGNYAEALKNNFASLTLTKSIYSKAKIYLNIGEVYLKQENYDEALKSFYSALQFQFGDTQLLSNSYKGIGGIYMHQGKFKNALKNYLSALEMEKKMSYKYEIADSYIRIGKAYIKLHQLENAENYLQKGLQFAKENESKAELKDAYAGLSVLDSVRGNINEAFRYYILYSAMKDSMTNEESNKQISQLKIQYETDKKDQQINTQTLRINTQNLQLQNNVLQNKVLQTKIYYGIAISLMVISIIVLLYYLSYSQNKRKKKEYTSRLIELELIALKAQLNPHFIFNTLISIKSYIDANPDGGTNYLGLFSLLLRGVLENTEEKEINLGEEMQLVEHYIKLERLCMSNHLDYTITYDPSLNKDNIMVPPFITQPAIENAIRHGLNPVNENRKLYIHNSLVDDTLIISIKNNAIKDEEKSLTLPKRKSFGIKITRERLILLKQTTGKEGNLILNVLPNETEVKINIPLTQI